MSELRITTTDRVCLELWNKGNREEIPTAMRAWAALYSGLGLKLEPMRIVISTSRFLKVLPKIGAFNRQYSLETQLDDATERLMARFRDERAGWSRARNQEEGPSFITQETASEILEAAEFKRLKHLRNHQWDAILKTVNLRNGANFSVPGAGKTTVLLAVHAIHKYMHGDTGLLIIAPRNVMGAWDDEIRECFLKPDHIVRLTRGADGVRKALAEKPTVSIMTYEQLRTTFDIVVDFLESRPTHLVLDESHRAKSGYNTIQGSAVLELAPAAIRRDILSGTPMPQGLFDICSQMSFLWPLEGQICGRYIEETTENAYEQANTFMAPFFARTTKQDLGLPPIELVDDYRALVLSPLQEQAYRILKTEATLRYRNSNLENHDRLKTLGKQVVNLLQIASNPGLAYRRMKDDPALRDHPDFLEVLRRASEEEVPAKFRALETLVNQILSSPNEKVVIWSGFVKTIERIEAMFSQFGPLTIHGGIKTGSDEDASFREARVKIFNNDPYHRIMVANPAAGGEGISLHHAAHNAIYFDRNFNATHYLQSVDRIHRLGLPEGTVTKVYLLEAKGTVDEIVAKRLQAKIDAMESVLNTSQIQKFDVDFNDESVTENDDEGGMDAGDIEALLADHLKSDSAPS